MNAVLRHALRFFAATALVALLPTMGATNYPVQGSSSTAGVPRTDAAGITWLCRPGLANDPCTSNMASTAVQANGSTTITRLAPATSPAFDCFYVYPTVSREPAVNADLTVQPAETAAAVAQASRFSQVCQVWAPMYRQSTLLTLSFGPAAVARATPVAYQSMLAGWQDYLAHYNQGRPIIFIGHSQGAALLIDLLRSQVDQTPALRHLLVSAIILGGNVVVPTTAGAQGSFQHIPACSATARVGCVIAYSSYPSQPPPDSLFGRPGQGVSNQSGQTTTSGVQVLCVNPATLNASSGPLDTYFPVADVTTRGVSVTTPWVEYPNLYTAQCEHAGGATWLNVTASAVPGDPRSRVTEAGGAVWGYHVADVNLALGNLVRDVQQQEVAYRAASS